MRKIFKTALTKYLVNGGVGRQGTVEDTKLALQSLWNVVATTTRLDHGCYELYVHNVCEVSWLLQVVHALVLHHLPGDLIGHLISPLIDDWHVDIIYEAGHPATSRRAIGTAHPLLYIALYCPLEDKPFTNRQLAILYAYGRNKSLPLHTLNISKYPKYRLID